MGAALPRRRRAPASRAVRRAGVDPTAAGGGTERKAEVERELRRDRYVAREEGEVTFGVYYEQWPSRTRRISKARSFTDNSRARLHVLPQWADRPLSTIRPSDVDDWVAELSRKMGPYSVRH